MATNMLKKHTVNQVQLKSDQTLVFSFPTFPLWFLSSVKIFTDSLCTHCRLL